MSLSVPVVEKTPPSRADLTPECIHCGLCLQACPTYIELGREADSPRGRIYLMRAQQRGVMPVSESFVQHISACLDCRGCESACPSGVPYGELVEKAREVIEHNARRPFWVQWFRSFIFKTMFPSRRLLRLNFDLLRWYQRSGLQKLVRALGILKLFPGTSGWAGAVAPRHPEQKAPRCPGLRFSGTGREEVPRGSHDRLRHE